MTEDIRVRCGEKGRGILEERIHVLSMNIWVMAQEVGTVPCELGLVEFTAEGTEIDAAPVSLI